MTVQNRAVGQQLSAAWGRMLLLNIYEGVEIYLFFPQTSRVCVCVCGSDGAVTPTDRW